MTRASPVADGTEIGRKGLTASDAMAAVQDVRSRGQTDGRGCLIDAGLMQHALPNVVWKGGSVVSINNAAQSRRMPSLWSIFRITYHLDYVMDCGDNHQASLTLPLWDIVQRFEGENDVEQVWIFGYFFWVIYMLQICNLQLARLCC